jgi:DNA-binding IscR family transcriptional regulator
MKKKRHTPEEIIKKLREAEGLIASGKGARGGFVRVVAAMAALADAP